MDNCEYKIEIGLRPHYHDNEKEPYFWCLLTWNVTHKEWYNNGFGWAESPEKAWEQAYIFYKKYHRQ